MTKKFLWLALITLLALPLGLVSAADFNFAAITVTPLRYEPFPAQPGSYMKLWISVENIGTEPAEDLLVVLEPQYPFFLDASENATRQIRTLNGKDNTVIDYKIRVAPDAVEGENELRIKYSIKDRDEWTEKVVRIELQTLDANLDVVSVSSANVAPGGVVPLEIKLKNKGDSPLRDISVRLNLSDVPFYPINSISEKKIYLINSSGEEMIAFDIMASPAAICQPYKVPMTLSYKTLDGTQYTKLNYLTIVVGSAPEIIVDIESSEIMTSGKTGIVTLNIINKGLTNIKFLTITLKEGDYDIISPPEIYIGNLDSDDFDTAEFKIYTGKQGTTLPINVALNYRDSNNGLHQEEKTLPLRLYTADELGRFQLTPPQNNTWLIVIVIAVAVIGYWIYRRRKKRK